MKIRWIRKFIPSSFKDEIRRVITDRVNEGIDPNTLIRSLYSPGVFAVLSANSKLTWDRTRKIERSANDPLPVPPPGLRMGYETPTDQDFLDWGFKSATSIRRILAREGVSFSAGKSILEWGCASGRVLRHFADEAAIGNVWGIDRDTQHLHWAKENLSPPFKFLTCTAYPYLPFEDGKFHLIYGISVFTHMIHLIDSWLMEFRRILAPGGYALFTVQDEHTWQWILEHKKKKGFWYDFMPFQEMEKGMQHDVYVLQGKGSNDWGSLYTFFKSDWIKQEWGKYLDVVAIEPRAEEFQSMVVLRKA